MQKHLRYTHKQNNLQDERNGACEKYIQEGNKPYMRCINAYDVDNLRNGFSCIGCR